MGKMEKISVELTPELGDMVQGMVESGEFSSVDEVVISALTEWQSKRLIHGFAAEELGMLWDEGLASGEPIDGEEAFRRIASELEQEIARREP
ncbi:antitoxin ParD1/3/4 [Neorhizobium sp. 2083]|uniref:ribbon-helix-helix domain-containing protein n=1 Tax=Neorhizobium sp. 2083 TaxID=2817762 RepID=UPI002863FC1A|nr:type II toxin-antitoxin system ParD family antitoxin [Neorhizobium sp. 2083]MDR6818792.1 antitoxin ParD1/3/4 [Neorhizobium sp. 2083]